MGISKIKKIELIGLQEKKNEILSLLQGLGIVQLADSQEGPVAPMPLAADSADLAEIEEALGLLETYRAKKSLLAGMVRLKPSVYQQEFSAVVSEFDYRTLVKRLFRLRDGLHDLLLRREKLAQERLLLFPWRSFGLPLEQVNATRTCGLVLGYLGSREHAYLLKDIEKAGLRTAIEEVGRDNANVYLAITFLKEESEPLEGLLKGHRFSFVALPHARGTVGERLEEIRKEAEVLESKVRRLKEEVVGLTTEEFKLGLVCDYLANAERIQTAERHFNRQRFTFFVRGWIRQNDLPTLESALASSCPQTALFVSDPSDQEEVPVALENNWFVQPFEFITTIYGFPKYSELDPTPYLAPFFFLYFGFCVSDVGYGLVLVFLSSFVLWRFKMGPQGKRFFRLFLFCGISTILVGALTGSWFGNLVDLLAGEGRAFAPLKAFKDRLILLDPMKEPTRLLGIALGLGILQVWFGNIVAAIGNFKNRRYLNILLDQVPMLVFLFGLTGLGLVFLNLFAADSGPLFAKAGLAGGVSLLLTQGRAEKGIGGKLFYGAFNLYNALSGYLSDILSYSRLWALGLVTGVMAVTINLISVQFSQIAVSLVPFIGRSGAPKIVLSGLILALIFIAGHLISFCMNLLGAFVHPVRLQFVEFFSKFFKAGGSAFRPFKVETKYVTIMKKED